jgi:hypothetical protein
MDDVTTTVDRAATCLRDLWNTYFYAGDELSAYPAVVEDLFAEIETRIFGALVLVAVDREAFIDEFRREPLAFLIVVPAFEGVPLLIRRPSADRNWYWDAYDGRVGPNEVELHFLEWFDWNDYAPRAFQYYRTKVHAFDEHPEFVGREALIECRSARVFLDPSVR